MSIAATVRKVLTSKIPYHIGSPLPNRLGLQVVRATTKHVAWRLRPSRSLSQEGQTLLTDGIVLLHDFLPAHEFELVRAEYERSRRSDRYTREFDYARAIPASEYANPSPASDEDWAICETLDGRKHADSLPHAIRLLRDNRRLNDIVSSVSRRPLKAPPALSVMSWRRAGPTDTLVNEKDRGRPRGADYVLHADTHYPTFKAWFHLSAVDETNGAFVYVKRSHRLSVERLKYEYVTSIRVAESKRDGTWKTMPYGHIRRIRNDFLRDLGLREESICVPENTAVIADTSGFHRRGDFLTDRPREQIALNWRHLESWAQFLNLQ